MSTIKTEKKTKRKCDGDDGNEEVEREEFDGFGFRIDGKRK